MPGIWLGGNKQRHEAIIDALSSVNLVTSSSPGWRRLLRVVELRKDCWWLNDAVPRTCALFPPDLGSYCVFIWSACCADLPIELFRGLPQMLLL